jgi:type IV secretory pathway VirJ component
MARELAGLDALVAGINIVHYLKSLARSHERCSYPAADFENLSHYLQQRLGFPHYTLPVLIGVAGLNSLKYFWTPRTPEELARTWIGSFAIT